MLPAAHGGGSLSHDEDMVLISIMQIRIEVVATEQFSSRKGAVFPLEMRHWAALENRAAL